MDLRNTFSKPFKKLRDKFPGGRRKRDGRSGSEDSRKQGQADVSGGEASQRSSYLHPEVSVKAAVESGPSGEGGNIGGKGAALIEVDPPTSTPSISNVEEPDST